MIVKKSTKRRAEANPVDHRFIHGRGYLEYGEPKLSIVVAGKGLCAPPDATGDMTSHLLQPPSGGPPMAFKWLSNAKAWLSFPAAGNRMAFKADYLSQAGWTYSGPAN